jgi:guanylate kinase
MGTGRLVVLTGPSGVGKGTLVRSLLQRHPELCFSVSVTTRTPRFGEVEGKAYFFVSRSQFEQMVADGALLEWAEFAGNFYGTPRRAVEQQICESRWVILEIELEGARQIRHTFPDALQIFILPPSLTELETRLRDRGQDPEESIVERLKRAEVELNAADEFDVQVINDDLEIALDEIEMALFSPAELLV